MASDYQYDGAHGAAWQGRQPRSDPPRCTTAAEDLALRGSPGVLGAKEGSRDPSAISIPPEGSRAHPVMRVTAFVGSLRRPTVQRDKNILGLRPRTRRRCGDQEKCTRGGDLLAPRPKGSQTGWQPAGQTLPELRGWLGPLKPYDPTLWRRGRAPACLRRIRAEVDGARPSAAPSVQLRGLRLPAPRVSLKGSRCPVAV